MSYTASASFNVHCNLLFTYHLSRVCLVLNWNLCSVQNW